MTKIVYRPGPNDPIQVTRGNVVFTKDQPVEVTDEYVIETARGNPWFDVDGEDKAKAREEASTKAAVDFANAEIFRINAEAAALDERQEREVAALEAKHQQERDAFENANHRTLEYHHKLADQHQPPDDPPQSQTSKPQEATQPQAQPQMPPAQPGV